MTQYDSLHIDYLSLILYCLFLSKIIYCVQMPVKKVTKRKPLIPSASDTSSRGNDDFVISPHARRSTRRVDKAPRGSGAGSSSQHAEEELSDAIQKVIPPLKLNYLNTFQRVDRRHPRRPIDYTRKENDSMIQRNDDPYVWAPDLHDHKL
jgi:hypothetical protein